MLGSMCSSFHKEIVLDILLEGFPSGSVVKNPPTNAGDVSSIPGLGRSPGKGNELTTSVFWPREFYGLYSAWGPKELDMTEQLSHTPIYTFSK